MITGVGIPSTMYHLQKKLQKKNIDLVIQAGIAGTFSDTIGLGEVVLVKQDTFGDIGMEEKETFTTIFHSGLIEKDAFPFNNGWLINKNAFLNHSFLPPVLAITINKVSDNLLQRQQAITNFSPEIESMEGAACHYICLQENIPFIQMRSISNLVGERDKNNWRIQEAIKNLNVELARFVNMVLGFA